LSTTRNRGIVACGVRREDCESTRQWITNVREALHGLKRAASDLVDDMEREASRSGGNAHAQQRVIAGLEAKHRGISKEIQALEDEALAIQAEIADDGRGQRQVNLAQPATRIGQDSRYSSGTDDARAGVLAPEHRMADWAARNAEPSEFNPADAEDFCLGNVMRALVDTSYRAKLSDVERRALAEGTDSAGGYLTPTILSAPIIDKVRNAARVFQAGAVTIPLDSDQQTVPRLATDPSGGWRNENAAFAEGNHVFESVTFTPRSFGFIVKTSEELYQDMIPGGAQMIENAIVQAAALELDRVALRGTGTAPEPRGVVNQTGVELQSLGVNGATPTMDNLITGVYGVRKDNHDPNAILWAARTGETYAKLKTTTNEPLPYPPEIADIPRLTTGQIPVDLTVGTSTDCSEVYIGEWANLLVGIRLGIQLRLLTERYADNGQFAWRVHLRADVQLAHPAAFTVITGVRP
jgi:HK97 family phage major capsid protein